MANIKEVRWTEAEKTEGQRLAAGELSPLEVHLCLLIDRVKKMCEAGELLAEEVRDILDECSDDSRSAALAAWREVNPK